MSDKKTTPKKTNSSNMTRAVVANLNRQQSSPNRVQNSSPSRAANSSNGKDDSNKHSPQKSLPPKPNHSSKDLPDIPEFFVVRPAPSTPRAKVERNDRRLFIDRKMMERMGLGLGMVVLMQKHDPEKAILSTVREQKEEVFDEDGDTQPESDDEDDDALTTVGIAWPMDKIEPNVVRMTSSLRESAGLQLGDHVTLAPYRSPVDDAKEVILEQDESSDAPAEREILRFVLQQDLLRQTAGYVCVGMHLECTFRGIQHHFIVNTIKGPDIPDQSSLVVSLENLSLTSTTKQNAVVAKGTPIVFLMSSATKISFIGSSQKPDDVAAVTFSSIGGLQKQIKILRDMVEMPLHKPHLFVRFGMKPPRGVLLYGPPGTGKTMLLRAIANEAKAHVLTVNGPSILSKYQGETETTLRSIFAEALDQQPSIIFIDEIDALAPKRSAENEAAFDVTDTRVVATLLTLMDGMEGSGRVVVVAATNRPNAIDPALRRPGRFDKEIEVGIPDADARLEILRILLRKMPHTLVDTHVQSVAAKTHGYVGADLTALCTEAGMHCISNGLDNNIPEASMKVDQVDMEAALLVVRPSAMREIFLETQKVRWTDIGGQDHVKRKLREAVEWPLSRPNTFLALGMTPPRGLLLYGPPGCSKTMLAKALATETGVNFLAVKGPEIFNKYVGESERMIREIFKKARAASPSIIFFDEVDAMTTSRGGGGGVVNDRLIAALLNEMDGIEPLVNVTILAATNRPEMIDPALLRPGRIDRILYVGPPDLETRKEILQIEFRKMSIGSDVDVDDLAAKTEGCTGADLSALCRDAGIEAMYEQWDAKEIRKVHFDTALKSMVRSVGQQQLLSFEAFRLHSGIKSV